ncbi:MAG: 4Fe-4S dicluster domain-containing protein [Candidatus Coatesbacteria bacterium]|nr:4Fe-4S dicluster domain-containing protein [Candidatus Coatesbacteria bacterium]
MTELFKLSPFELNAWMDLLIAAGYPVFAPVFEEGTDKDNLYFKKIKKWNDADIGKLKTKRGPKELFFPINEDLFSYKYNGDGFTLEDPEIEYEPFIVAGLRPCDTAGLDVIDKLFSWDYKDEFYLKKREKAILIAFTCPYTDSSCFCTSVLGKYPYKDGSDIMLTQLKSKDYIVEILTEKGKKLLSHLNKVINPASKEDLKELKKELDNIDKSIKKIKIDKVKSWLENNFEDDYWKNCALECLSCGICTFVCPTCHCFDIIEDRNLDKITRRRTWDSCSFTDFTRMKVHQPRQEHFRRWRQRLMHKYYYYVNNFEVIACTGCGRCIESCPVGINIMTMLSEIDDKGKKLKAKA